MNSCRILQQPLRAAIIRAPNLTRFSVRNASTTTNANTSAQPSRWGRRLIYAGIFGTLGAGAGKWMDSKFAEPPLPGTIEDQAELEHIQRAYEIGLPIVQQLRQDPDFAESDVYENFPDSHKTRRLTSGPLAGSRGLGLQVSGVLVPIRIGCTRGGRIWASWTGHYRHAFEYRTSASRSWLT
jgi:hypothetical protein